MVEGIKDRYLYEMEISTGPDNEKGGACFARLSEFLDFLIVHEFAHPDLSGGVNLDKEKYSISLPPYPSEIREREFGEGYQCGLSECAVKK